MPISRSDIYLKSETGGEWFQEFLRTFSATNVQEILDAITNKKSSSIDGIMQEYRKMVGLDQLEEMSKTASTPADVIESKCINDKEKSIKEVKMSSVQRPISIRHAQAQSAIEAIKQNPQIQAQIDSFFEHSGGTKSITAVLNFIRKALQDVYISYSDHDLLDYLNNRKQYFTQNKLDDRVDVGLVGTDPNEDQGDNAADYITHGKK